MALSDEELGIDEGSSALEALSRRHLLFVIGYARHGNGARAARDAGFAPDHADITAVRLLGNVRVQLALKEISDRAIAAAQADVERVLVEVAYSALSDPAESVDENGVLLPLKQWPPELRRALGKLKIKALYETDEDGDQILVGYLQEVDFWNKLQAARTLIEVAGRLAPQKLDITVKQGLSERVAAGRKRVQEKKSA